MTGLRRNCAKVAAHLAPNFKMVTIDTDRFKGAEKYEAYLHTTAGMLRSDLAWGNLRRHFPAAASGRRALDVGGGTGLLSVRLAQAGFQVVLLDSSAEMLAIARKTAEAEQVTPRITFLHATADRLPAACEDSAFDAIVCHNVLEFVHDPAAVIRSLAASLDPDGRASFLVRNRAGEVLKAAIVSNDLAGAREALEAATAVDSLFGQTMRVFTPAEIRKMFQDAKLEVLAEYGVRVLSDYLNLEDLQPEKYERLLNLEFTLGAQPEFASIARYSQFIVGRSGASPGPKK
jgi:S-adenosylmethionine-dependent methyltransferase